MYYGHPKAVAAPPTPSFYFPHTRAQRQLHHISRLPSYMSNLTHSYSNKMLKLSNCASTSTRTTIIKGPCLLTEERLSQTKTKATLAVGGGYIHSKSVSGYKRPHQSPSQSFLSFVPEGIDNIDVSMASLRTWSRDFLFANVVTGGRPIIPCYHTMEGISSNPLSHMSLGREQLYLGYIGTLCC